MICGRHRSGVRSVGRGWLLPWVGNRAAFKNHFFAGGTRIRTDGDSTPALLARDLISSNAAVPLPLRTSEVVKAPRLELSELVAQIGRTERPFRCHPP